METSLNVSQACKADNPWPYIRFQGTISKDVRPSGRTRICFVPAPDYPRQLFWTILLKDTEVRFCTPMLLKQLILEVAPEEQNISVDSTRCSCSGSFADKTTGNKCVGQRGHGLCLISMNWASRLLPLLVWGDAALRLPFVQSKTRAPHGGNWSAAWTRDLIFRFPT